MSKDSFNIEAGISEGQDDSQDLANLSKNQIIFDFDGLEPVTERVKLDGDEYTTGKRHLDRKDAASSATMEIFKSLECLPPEC